MNNPLKNVPLNNKRVYVRGICKDGCKIYMPVDSFDDEDINDKKVQLQTYLNNKDNSYPSLVA